MNYHKSVTNSNRDSATSEPWVSGQGGNAASRGAGSCQHGTSALQAAR